MVNIEDSFGQKNQRDQAVAHEDDVIQRRPESDCGWSMDTDRDHRQKTCYFDDFFQYIVLL